MSAAVRPEVTRRKMPITTRKTFLRQAAGGLLLAGAATPGRASAPPDATKPQKPNVIFILADDLGYGDVGCYGQAKIKTPHLDRMAREGARFTDFYAASTVCAPSRCALLTGLHTGHCAIRGNGAGQNLRAGEVTLARVLQGAGYATSCIGKWGLGDPGSSGVPTRQGFDHFFGYLTHGHAHNYYPTFLYRGEKRVPLRNENPNEKPDGRGQATRKVEYTPDLFLREAREWIETQKGKPFFLYYAPTIPHGNNEARSNEMEVPDLGIYAGEPWPDAQKRKAAMISRLDAQVGALLDTLRTLGLEEKTLVLFSSDNGPHREGVEPEFFDSNGQLRGIKRDLYEGGIRVPMIARWPGVVPAGTVPNHTGYFPDVLPTLAEVTGAQQDAPTDGVSFGPVLRGQSNRQRRHPFLYWEFYERGGARAVRFENWKGVRRPFDGPVELYDLKSDPGETRDVAAWHPDVARRMTALMDKAHVPTPRWNAETARAGRKRPNPEPPDGDAGRSQPKEGAA